MLERIFGLKAHGTSVRTEVSAGFVTFLAISYIVVVNPSIHMNTGMSFSGVLLATILVTSLSSITMGLYANLPYAVAPGMGINAFFAFNVVETLGISWQTALGGVFLSGIVFIFLSITGIRTEIVKAIPPSLRLGMAAGIGVFLSLIGLSSVGFVEKDGTPTHVGRALLVDAFSTTISGLLGTSPGTAYVESAAGIKEGGRTGLAAVVTGLLFLPFMFLSPLLSFVPAVATAPVLVLVGLSMMRPLMEINWSDFEEALPAFICFMLIPLTFSITQGVMWGFLSYTILKLCQGKRDQIHWMVYLVDVFIILELLARHVGHPG